MMKEKKKNLHSIIHFPIHRFFQRQDKDPGIQFRHMIKASNNLTQQPAGFCQKINSTCSSV